MIRASRRTLLGVALGLVFLAPTSAQEDGAAAALRRGPAVSFDKDGFPTVDVTVAEGARDLVLVARPVWKNDDAAPVQTFELEKVEGRRFRATLACKLPAGGPVDYELLAGTTSLGKWQLTTLPKGERLTFCALGDSGWPRRGTGTATEEQLAVGKLLAAQKPDLALHTGDVIYLVGQESGLDPLVFKPYGETLSRVPFFFCLGNHDTKTRAGAPELSALPYPPNGNKNRFYSFDAANVHFAAIDSNDVLDCDGPDAFFATAQGKWLRADLAGTTLAWKVVFFHHPLYNCSPRRPKESEQMRRVLETFLEDSGVDVVLTGHEHYYHRTIRLRAGKAAPDGMIHVLTGGGGAPLYDGEATQPTTAVFEKRFHLVRFDVDGLDMKIEALGYDKDGAAESLDKLRILNRKTH